MSEDPPLLLALATRLSNGFPPSADSKLTNVVSAAIRIFAELSARDAPAPATARNFKPIWQFRSTIRLRLHSRWADRDALGGGDGDTVRAVQYRTVSGCAMAELTAIVFLLGAFESV
jgi:hypothetical protein